MKRTLLIAASTLIVSGLGGVAFNDRATANPAGNCNMECVDCGATGNHFATGGQDWGGADHGLLGCLEGNCCAHHGQCPRSGCGGQLAALDDAWKNLDVAKMATELERLGDQVILNRKRSAIQLLGCDGAIMGHLPVSKHTFARIADALD